ncbi:MAG: hypothetical protein AAF086_03175 [Planctomycetota bacterium]
MKYLFFGIASILTVSAMLVRLSYPDVSSDRPVIYWITDKNPAHYEQVETFHRWPVEQGHTAEDGGPICVDFANRSLAKQVIQTVSGAGSGTMDILGGSQMRLFQDMGVIHRLDEAAMELGFGLDRTYDAVRPEVATPDGQYTYPCNVITRMCIHPRKLTNSKVDAHP